MLVSEVEKKADKISITASAPSSALIGMSSKEKEPYVTR